MACKLLMQALATSLSGGASKYIQYGNNLKGTLFPLLTTINMPLSMIDTNAKVTQRYYFDETLVRLLRTVISTSVIGTTLVKMVMLFAQIQKLLLMAYLINWKTSQRSLSMSLVFHTTTMLLEPVCQTLFLQLKVRPTNLTLTETEHLSDIKK
ncbi:MAG: hypothetical protein ACLT8V_00115 [Streptococcus salivarius]